MNGTSAEVFLSTSPMFTSRMLGTDAGGSISPDDLDFIKGIGQVRRYKKSALLLGIGNLVQELFLIKKGVVRISMLGRNGVEKPVLYVASGCFWGEEGFFHGQPVIYNAKAIKEVEVLAVEKKYASDIISRPGLAHLLIKSISLKSRILAHQVEDFAFRNTVEKLCRLLFCLLTDPASSFYNNKNKLTHQELAAIAGVHRVTVTNAIAQLKREGIIHILHDGEKEIEDWVRLRMIGFGE